MGETQIQAIVRIIRLAIVAVIAVLIANGGELLNLIPEGEVKYLVSIILVPLLDGIAKLIGGPTVTPTTLHGRGAGLEAAERPNFFAV